MAQWWQLGGGQREAAGCRRVKETCKRLDCFPLANLTALDISRTGMDAEGLAPLMAATRLEHLDCHECSLLTCSALSCLSGTSFSARPASMVLPFQPPVLPLWYYLFIPVLRLWY
jgi:hypothetical protein